VGEFGGGHPMVDVYVWLINHRWFMSLSQHVEGINGTRQCQKEHCCCWMDHIIQKKRVPLHSDS